MKIIKICRPRQKFLIHEFEARTARAQRDVLPKDYTTLLLVFMTDRQARKFVITKQIYVNLKSYLTLNTSEQPSVVLAFQLVSEYFLRCSNKFIVRTFEL